MKLSKSFWLILVLCIAAFLRFYGIWDQEFSYDELSAIFRAENAKNWQQHIHSGVIPDGHPAGLQTFIWLFIQLFGVHLIWLKSIMVVCGIAAVYFIYRATKNIANENAAILASSMLAVLHLPLFWSLQLRPYAPGLMVVSGLLWTASELAFAGSQKRIFYWLTIFFLASAFYTHYFAGLTAVVIFFTAFFLLHRRQKLSYILCGAAAFILFVPHISITLKQFANKGLGWLNVPSSSFFADHINVAFSNSWLLFFLVFTISLTGFLLSYKHGIFSLVISRRIFFLLAVFILPLLTGFLYSIFRAPVLQHSVLLFSMPALFILFAFFAASIPSRIFRVYSILFWICGISVLVFGRKFYAQENFNAYRSELECANYYAWTYGKKNISIWMDGENDILEYHIQKNAEPGISYNRLKYYQNRNFFDVLDKLSRTATGKPVQYLGMGLQSGVDAYLKAELEERFGLPQKAHYFNGGEFLIFALKNTPALKYTRLSPDLNKPNPELVIHCDTLAHEDFIVIRLKSIGIKGEIQTAIYDGNEQIDWRSSEIKPYYFLPGDLTYSTNLHVIKLADIPKWNPDCKIKIHLKTEDRKSDYPIQELQELSWRKMKGNPYIYGIK